MPNKETYERYAHTLRCLINYHKRMMMFSGFGCDCSHAEANKGECPRITVLNDVYLGALEESLRLIEERVATFGGG